MSTTDVPCPLTTIPPGTSDTPRSPRCTVRFPTTFVFRLFLSSIRTSSPSLPNPLLESLRLLTNTQGVVSHFSNNHNTTQPDPYYSRTHQPLHPKRSPEDATSDKPHHRSRSPPLRRPRTRRSRRRQRRRRRHLRRRLREREKERVRELKLFGVTSHTDSFYTKRRMLDEFEAKRKKKRKKKQNAADELFAAFGKVVSSGSDDSDDTDDDFFGFGSSESSPFGSGDESGFGGSGGTGTGTGSGGRRRGGFGDRDSGFRVSFDIQKDRRMGMGMGMSPFQPVLHALEFVKSPSCPAWSHTQGPVFVDDDDDEGAQSLIRSRSLGQQAMKRRGLRAAMNLSRAYVDPYLMIEPPRRFDISGHEVDHPWVYSPTDDDQSEVESGSDLAGGKVEVACGGGGVGTAAAAFRDDSICWVIVSYLPTWVAVWSFQFITIECYRVINDPEFWLERISRFRGSRFVAKNSIARAASAATSHRGTRYLDDDEVRDEGEELEETKRKTVKSLRQLLMNSQTIRSDQLTVKGQNDLELWTFCDLKGTISRKALVLSHTKMLDVQGTLKISSNPDSRYTFLLRVKLNAYFQTGGTMSTFELRVSRTVWRRRKRKKDLLFSFPVNPDSDWGMVPRGRWVEIVLGQPRISLPQDITAVHFCWKDHRPTEKRGVCLDCVLVEVHDHSRTQDCRGRRM